MLVVRSREIAPSIWHQGYQMLLLRLMRVLSVSLLFSAAQGKAQVPTEHPELIAGPWEVASTSGIEGIFFEIVTSSSGPTGGEQFDWQTMNIACTTGWGGKLGVILGQTTKPAYNPMAWRMITLLRFLTESISVFTLPRSPASNHLI